MAALKEIAREYASEIRDGIGWVIVYRTGRSWNALTVWSDLGNNEWETDDINDALEALRLDPRAVALNGYYLGRFGDMTIDDIAAGIRWHYERGTNALADDDTLMQARADIEAARQQAAEAGLPFSERLVDGPEDEPNLYAYRDEGAYAYGSAEAVNGGLTGTFSAPAGGDKVLRKILPFRMTDQAEADRFAKGLLRDANKEATVATLWTGTLLREYAAGSVVTLSTEGVASWDGTAFVSRIRHDYVKTRSKLYLRKPLEGY